jgi:HK97 family phage major capsid protein
MANAIPMLEGTPGSGGYAVRPQYGPTLIDAINRESAVAALATVRQVNTSVEKYLVYKGRPQAAFVAEGAPKAATGAEFAEAAVNMKKIAATVMYTEEMLADAIVDPTSLVNNDVTIAFADLTDAHALGMQAGAAITTNFDSGLTNTTQTVELGTTGDALAVAISVAMGKIESNGYRPNGIILANDGRVHMRAARGSGDFAAQPLYTAGFAQEPTSMYGLPITYSTNLTTFAAAAASGNVVGLVGDFSNAILGIRKDIEMRATAEATIDVGGTLHHLFQQNKTAILWEARMGFLAHDLDRSFCAIINAA